MKNLFRRIPRILVLAAALVAPVASQAQLGTNTTQTISAVGGVVGPYLLITGTNNIFTNSTTQLYTNAVILPVAQHPNVGVELYYTALSAATNGSVILKFVKSYDNGNLWETTPSISLTNTLPTAVQYAANSTNWVQDFDVSVPNATHIQLYSAQNTATGGTLTNAYIIFNLNNPTYWTTPAQH